MQFMSIRELRQPVFLKEIEQARKEYRRKGGVSLAQAKKRLEAISKP